MRVRRGAGDAAAVHQGAADVGGRGVSALWPVGLALGATALVFLLAWEIAALAAPSVADSPPPEREGVRDRLTSTFRPPSRMLPPASARNDPLPVMLPVGEVLAEGGLLLLGHRLPLRDALGGIGQDRCVLHDCSSPSTLTRTLQYESSGFAMMARLKGIVQGVGFRPRPWASPPGPLGQLVGNARKKGGLPGRPCLMRKQPWPNS